MNETTHDEQNVSETQDDTSEEKNVPISLEETWMTMRWPNRVFSFILAVFIVNIQNAASNFLNKAKMDALQSR